eukprot:TRINITY_DN8994_c0_g1_i1.p1 TRINITY_DN8994_c0_g1~~TRINITY_DN8994_c0_g1_i1.p1  ORF type:complete len:295 (-),score=92.51 TRINITY_DN8994_c0_g1_i1:77-961(-)
MQRKKLTSLPNSSAAAPTQLDPSKVSATWWLNVVLLLIALLPPLVLLPSEIDKQWLVGGRMRAFNFYDMVLIAPFWMFAMLKMHLLNVGIPGRSTVVSTICACLSVVFFYGHAMHVTGDSINSYMTEVHPEYRQRVPDDLYELIYLLDEDLSHLLLFIALFTLYGIWTFESNVQIQKDGSFWTGPWPSRIAGFVHGFSCTFASYETGHPWLGVYSILWNLFNWWRKSLKTKKTRNYVMVSFVLPYCFMLGTGLVLYFVLMGGNLQPSEIGGVFGVMKRARETLGIAHYFSDTVF